MAKVFEASYTGGRCPDCGDDIEKGDEVSYSADGSLLHAECNPASEYDSYFYDD